MHKEKRKERKHTDVGKAPEETVMLSTGSTTLPWPV